MHYEGILFAIKRSKSFEINDFIMLLNKPTLCYVMTVFQIFQYYVEFIKMNIWIE